MGNVIKYNPNEFNIGGNKVNVYSKPKKGLKYKLTKNEKILLGTVIGVGLSVLALFSAREANLNKSVVIPNDKVVYSASYDVNFGDKIGDIAKRYYSEEEKEVYGSLEKYKKVLKDNLSSKLHDGQNVDVQNIIDSDNPLYLKLLDIDSKLEELQKDMWKEYCVTDENGFIALAGKIVASDDQIDSCISMIKTANGISGNILRPGNIIVPNPKYFEFQKIRSEIKKELDESLVEETVRHHM